MAGVSKSGAAGAGRRYLRISGDRGVGFEAARALLAEAAGRGGAAGRLSGFRLSPAREVLLVLGRAAGPEEGPRRGRRPGTARGPGREGAAPSRRADQRRRRRGGPAGWSGRRAPDTGRTYVEGRGSPACAARRESGCRSVPVRASSRCRAETAPTERWDIPGAAGTLARRGRGDIGAPCYATGVARGRCI